MNVNISNIDLSSLDIDLSNDPHTARFFDAKHHRGRVEKFFRPFGDNKATPSQIFAGRRAQLLTGEDVIVVQPFFLSSSGGATQKGAVLVTGSDGYLASQWNRVPNDLFAWLFWARELFGGGGSTPAQRRAFSLPCELHWTLSRYHVPPDESLALRVSFSGYCSLLNMDARSRRDDAMRELSFEVDENFRQSPPKSSAPKENEFTPTSDLVAMGDEQLHQRLSLIASEGGSLLYERLRFARLSEEQRAYEVLGCDMVTLQRAMELFRLALQAEMYEGSTLGVYEKLEFRPFLPYQQLCMAPNQTKRIAMPTSLRRRRSQILKALKCHVAPGRFTGEERTEHLNEWAMRWVCRCSPAESMHEVFVAESRFNELLKAYRVR